jgi:hypothetical protein
VLLRHPDRCKLEQFEASRHRGRSGQKVLVLRTDDALTVDCSDGCKEFDSSYLESVKNLLEV